MCWWEPTEVGRSGSGFRTSPQPLAVGSAPAGQTDAAFGERPGFGELLSQTEMKNREKTHLICVFFSVPASCCKLGDANPDGLGCRHRDGGSVPAPATPSPAPSCTFHIQMHIWMLWQGPSFV